MKPKKLIVTGAVLFTIAFFYGVCESITFIIEYGWHHTWNRAEIICHEISGFGVCMGGSLMVWGFGNIVYKEGE